MPVTSIVIMLILAATMFYGQMQYKKKGAEWGKLVTIVCGFSIIGTALYTNLCSSGIDYHALDIERQYQQVQLKYLAANLAKKYTGNGSCLIIHDPTDEKGMKYIDQMVQAIEEGFGEKLTLVRPVPIKGFPQEGEDDEELSEEFMMEMYEVTAEQFNQVIKDNNDCDVIICLTSLPYSEEELYKISPFMMIEDEDNPGDWVKDPDKKYPLVGIFNGYIGNLAQLIDDDLIGAITLWKNKPDMTYKSIPDDLEEAFNKRFMLINAQNINELRKTNPKMFAQEIEEE